MRLPCWNEYQKIIHFVAFYKVIFFLQTVPCLLCFVEDHVAAKAVIFAVAVAVDDSNLRSGTKGELQISQKSHGLRYLVICLQEQDGIDNIGGQERVVGLAENSFDVMQFFFLRAVA